MLLANRIRTTGPVHGSHGCSRMARNHSGGFRVIRAIREHPCTGPACSGAPDSVRPGWPTASRVVRHRFRPAGSWAITADNLCLPTTCASAGPAGLGVWSLRRRCLAGNTTRRVFRFSRSLQCGAPLNGYSSTKYDSAPRSMRSLVRAGSRLRNEATSMICSARSRGWLARSLRLRLMYHSWIRYARPRSS